MYKDCQNKKDSCKCTCFNESSCQELKSNKSCKNKKVYCSGKMESSVCPLFVIPVDCGDYQIFNILRCSIGKVVGLKLDSSDCILRLKICQVNQCAVMGRTCSGKGPIYIKLSSIQYVDIGKEVYINPLCNIASSGVGPQGATGPMGPMGPMGPQGATGPMGPMGPMGPQGATGPMGSMGPQGATGPMGPMGPQGATGSMGPQGATGPMGPMGSQGATGATGPMGPMGSQGATGPMGATGATGPMGPMGPIGPTAVAPEKYVPKKIPYKK